jgi:hypothetical protein
LITSNVGSSPISNVALSGWAKAFGKVIRIGESHGSGALAAFEGICDAQLPLIYGVMEARGIFKCLEDIKSTHSPPLLLLKTLTNLEMSQPTLLNLRYSKHRPPPTLVKASQAYIALSVQLRLELPPYLSLLEHGIWKCLLEWSVEYKVTIGEMWDDFGVIYGLRWVWKVGVVMGLGSV